MIKKFKKKVKNFIKARMAVVQIAQNTQIEQALMVNQYHLMKNMLTPAQMPALKDVGFQVFSQFEEDGLLLYVFTIIGTTNKRVVEICAGDGRECMAANLIINHGWEGLLFDGNKAQVETGIDFFASNKSTFLLPPVFKHAWITRENINQLIADSGFVGEIDLLSLDIDGNDYYIMDAIDVIKPRVIICETQNVIPGNLSLTIPYKANFNREEGDVHVDYSSVSLLAMKKLLNKKGYRMIGAHRYGFNVIFMLNEIGQDYFPAVDIESIDNNTYTKIRREQVWDEIKGLPWVEVK